MIEINERWLMDTVGWPVFKEGRQVYRAGGVLAVQWDADKQLLRGTLTMGRQQRVAGMRIVGPTEVENLCRCPQSQREGAICAHSAAVAFAWIEKGDSQAIPQSEAGSDSLPAGTGPGKAQTASGAAGAGGAALKGSLPRLDKVLAVQVETDFLRIWEKGKLPLRFAVEAPKDSEGAEWQEFTPEILAACARFSGWLTKHRIDMKTPPPFAVLDRRQAMDFFAGVAGYPWLTIAGKAPLRVATTALRPTLSLNLGAEVDEEGEPWVQLALDLGRDGGAEATLLSAANGAGEFRSFVYDAHNGNLLPMPTSGELLEELLQGEDEVWRTMRWIVEHLDELNDQFHLDTRQLGTPLRVATAVPRFELSLEGSLNALTARLLAIYPQADENGETAERRVPAGAGARSLGFPLRDPIRTGLYWRRNDDRERRAVEKLQSAGFRAADDRGRWALNGRDAVLAFFGSELPEWREDGCEVILGERLVHVTRGLQRIAPKMQSMHQGAGESWFECEFSFSSASGAVLKESQIRQLLASGRREVALPSRKGTAKDNELLPSQSDGVGVVDAAAVEEWREVLKDLDAEQVSPGKFRIGSQHRDYLLATLGTEESSKNLDETIVYQKFAELNDTLRSYQRDGIHWLCQRLLEPGLRGAVLADEMGLGKTLQTLATIRLLRYLGGPEFSGAPALVVAPTSLLTNWQAEAERFTPELRSLIFHGSNRDEVLADLPKSDLVITSYGVLMREVDAFRKQSLRFGLAVLDEASYVRNPATKVAKAVRKIDCAARLALTGTPVENSVRDLWAIVDFALPGCLGGREEFRQRYELPLASAVPPDKLMARLRRRVKPHLLRRTKLLVAPDLPEKIEQVRYCELSADQRSLYAQLVDASRQTVRDALGNQGNAGKARMVALTSLLRLRQVCCDPRLLQTGDGNDPTKKPLGSAKLELLRESLREAREGGHRVLIFSQFVSMLKLIADQLTDDDCKYAWLDGSNSATERARQVRYFQEDPTVPVFLISLKAGGYGLNLTAADTVIHYDPWWNPAVEAQATDRAHRIGQERPVTSLKLICRGTVEEKILKLQQRKSSTFGAAVEDDAPLMQGLSDEEIREVLEI